MNRQDPDSSNPAIPKKPPMTLKLRRLGPAVPAIAILAAVFTIGLFAIVADRPCPLSAGLVAGNAEAIVSASDQAPATADAGLVADDSGAAGQASRAAVEKLIAEQKFEAAAAECARIRDDARKRGDNALWAWALIKEGQLRTSLHGYETAVRFFKEQPWPDSPIERDMLELFFANSLVIYYHAYSWDIGQRERVESAGPIDLKSWTRDQIFDEAWQALMRVWKDRDGLAARKPGEFPGFWSVGDYPAGVRDSLRDAVIYLMAGLLSDTTFWTPRQSNETWLLDLPKLLSRAGKTSAAEAAEVLGSTSSHPVEKAAALLGEHESWSRRADRPAAALEARFELVRALYEAFDSDDSRALIRMHLAGFLASNRKDPWWATGQALLAEYTQGESAPDALVRARKIALEGVERFPNSPGGRHCLHIVKAIEAPEYAIEAMRLDAAGRRSVRITHRNLDRVFLRAYALDLEGLVKSSKDYYIFPQGEEARKIVERQRAAAAWRSDLATTADFRNHHTYANLPETLAPGLYYVTASAREDFGGTANKMIGLSVVVGDIVLIKREGGGMAPIGAARSNTTSGAGGTARAGATEGAGGEEVIALSGATGRPLPEVTVDLYAFDWKNGHAKIGSKSTDAGGRVWFAPSARGGSYFLLARKGRDIAFDSDYLYLQSRPEPADTRAALLYTDRSIYRPGQKLFWKVLAYKGRPDLGRISPDAGAAVTVWLEDINSQRVAQASASANAFGTASGEFTIPATGRPLGGWSLRSSPGGYASVRVEEYKRPTFEVVIKDPEKPLRLNRPAALAGEARYYFGLPASGGEAVWQVKREPVYPRWWWWDTGGGRSQTVAGGRAKVGADGTIDVAFTPRADEKKSGAGPGLSYRYTLSVDVTDEGGETRSAERSFRLGLVSVEARIEGESAFVRADAKAAFAITRADLDGRPKAGKGAWRVVRLIEPEKTLLPADQPMAVEPGTEDSAYPPTPGDRLRPRWNGAPSPDEILQLWREGGEAAKGTVEHDAQGLAKVEVPALGAGAYRLLYETKDDFGAVCKDSLSFLVAGKAKPVFKLPLVLRAEKAAVVAGGTARFLVDSGWSGQPMLLETFRGGSLWERRWIEAGKDSGTIDVPVGEDLRGGFGVRVTAIRDHQFMSEEASVFVPWDNKELGISFATFRDKLTPGGRETWRVTVKSPKGTSATTGSSATTGLPAEKGAAELLAYMYDRSLDLFAPHNPPRLLGLYPNRAGTLWWSSGLGGAATVFELENNWRHLPSYEGFRPDNLTSLGGYGIGGPGRRGYNQVLGGVVGGVLGGVVSEARAPSPAMARLDKATTVEGKGKEEAGAGKEPAAGQAGAELRSNFAETAFWEPHLLTGADGSATIEFTVPDSVTSWRVFVHGVTRDLEGGTLEAETKTVKDLMVRPYLPRFFREGDKADLRVMVNNAGTAPLAGEVSLEITDPLTGENLAPAFGLPAAVPARAFKVEAGGGTPVVFPLAAPARVGTVAFKVVAKSGALSDGELRPLPVLPGRMHLVQSRFATLKEGKTRELRFDDMAKTDDPTRINEQLVVTVDAQLFYGLLEALPYLINYPYECTEQTLNRFLSTGILTSLYDKYPQVARMAQDLSKRETVYETFDAADPNRKMALEETPWLQTAQGGKDAGMGIEKVLDPRVAKAQRETSLAKLLKAQTSLGAFPWWPGGPPSPYMTLYIVHGFSKAIEFGVEVPKDAVVRAFGYLHRHYLDEIVSTLMAHDTGWEFVTFLNYTISNFPDVSWTGGVFTDAERKRMLDFSFKHWQDHSPYLKGYLALTLKRAARPKDAGLVWDSVMDSAKTTVDGGTSWAPEDRGWLWYNDTIETHAFALRTLMELAPADARSEGLVQWLFLNKKLNHWKSTRATSEVIYSVASFLKKTGALGVRETITAEACGMKTLFTFEPDKYTGKKNQLVIAGDKLGPECATVRATKGGKGMAFASATWHFSTEKMPEKGDGDLFAVERTYFKREKKGDEVVLKPLAEGAPLAVGDEIEVQLSIRARHQAEYVHLRDPRPSGCEPVTLTSGYKWDLGLGRYEEIRDSGTNFFMEWLPEGEYTLKHRMRCAMAGTFKAAPATLESMYAPEFAAYSAGALVTIR